MSLTPGQRQRCVCGTDIVGARTLNAPGRPGADANAKPKVQPVVLSPDDEKGNVLLQQIDGELRAIVIGDAHLARHLRELGIQLRLNHFVDCPNAERFRRPAPTRPDQGAA